MQVQCATAAPGPDWRIAPVLMGDRLFVEAFDSSSAAATKQFLRIDPAKENQLVYTSTRSDATEFVVVPEAQRIGDPLRVQDLFYLRVAGANTSTYLHLADPLLRSIINRFNEARTFLSSFSSASTSASSSSLTRQQRTGQTQLADRLVSLKPVIEANATIFSSNTGTQLQTAADTLRASTTLSGTQQQVRTAIDLLYTLASNAARSPNKSLQLFAVDTSEGGQGSGVPLKIQAVPVSKSGRRGREGRLDADDALIDDLYGNSHRSGRFVQYGDLSFFNAPVFRRDDAGKYDGDIVCGGGSGRGCWLMDDTNNNNAATTFSVDQFAFVCSSSSALRFFKPDEAVVKKVESQAGTLIDLPPSARPISSFTAPAPTPTSPTGAVSQVVDAEIQRAEQSREQLNSARQRQAAADKEGAAALLQMMSRDPLAAQQLLEQEPQTAPALLGSEPLAWWWILIIVVAVLLVVGAIFGAIVYYLRKRKQDSLVGRGGRR